MPGPAPGLAPTPAHSPDHSEPGADGSHIFRATWQKRGVSSPGRGNCSPGSASAITGAGGCVQAPPRCDYRGLDRKLRLSRGAAPSERLTHALPTHTEPGTRQRSSEVMLEAVPVQPDLPGWWDLFPERHPASQTPPPASNSHLHSQPELTLCPLSPCFGPACGCWASPDAFPWENVFAAPGAHPLCHGKCSLWELPGQCQNCAAGFGPS